MKKLLALLVAVLMLCPILASCDLFEADSSTSDKEATKNMLNDNLINNSASQETEEKIEIVNNINGTTPKDAYIAAETLLLGMNSYHTKGTYSTTSTVSGTSDTTAFEFENKVTPTNMYTVKTMDDVVSEYYFSNNTEYHGTMSRLISKDTTTRDDFISSNMVGVINTNDTFGNWVEAEYLNLDAKTVEKKGDKYTLSIEMTADELTNYYEKEHGLTVIENPSIKIKVVFNSQCKPVAYEYSSSMKIDTTSYSFAIKMDILQTSDVLPIILPEWTSGTPSLGGNPGNNNNDATLNEQEDPTKIDYYNGIKYYVGTTPRIGDMNNDGKVTEIDKYLQENIDIGDENGDGVVNYDDGIYSHGQYIFSKSLETWTELYLK